MGHLLIVQYLFYNVPVQYHIHDYLDNNEYDHLKFNHFTFIFFSINLNLLQQTASSNQFNSYSIKTKLIKNIRYGQQA